MNPKTNKKNIALVLSSGGARGLAHIGVINQLEKMGYNITSIAGTSIGSLIGGLYAAGHLEDYSEWIQKLTKTDVFTLMDFQVKSEGFIKGNRVFQRMSPWIDNINIEDLPLPFSAISADILEREEVVFTSGNLGEAIRASVAVPGFVAPIYKNERWLFDGGVVNPMPLNRVKRTEGDLLLAVDLNAYVPQSHVKEAAKEEKKNISKLSSLLSRLHLSSFSRSTERKFNLSYFSLINSMFDMMQEKISHYELERTVPDVVIKVPRDICSTFEFYRAKEMITLGRKLTEKAINELQENE